MKDSQFFRRAELRRRETGIRRSSTPDARHRSLDRVVRPLAHHRAPTLRDELEVGQQLAHDGNPLAAWLLPVIGSPKELDRYIAACQIGITLSSLALGAYAQATIAVWLTPVFAELGGLQEVAAQSTSAAAVLLSLTVCQVVFAELVPKSLALQYPTATALYTPEFYRSCAARLAPIGAMTLHIASPVAHPSRIREGMTALRAAFPLVTPYLTSIPLYGGMWMMACASGTLDPRKLTAVEVDRRIGQRGIGDLAYYNGEMHRAALALPNFVRELVR